MPGNKDKEKKEQNNNLEVETHLGIIQEEPIKYTSNPILSQSTMFFNNKNASFNLNIAPNFSLNYNEDTEMYNLSYIKDENTILEHTFTHDFNYVYLSENQELFSITKQKSENVSADEFINNIKNVINDPNSKEELPMLLTTLMTEAYNYYDTGTDNILNASGFTRKDLGDTSVEIMSELFNTDGEILEGFVCSTISDFMMKLLHECNIEAVLFCGGNSYSDHTALLYKQGDNNYVYLDNGKFTMIEANNLKDAASAAHRNCMSPGQFGYIMFVDENNSYQEFDLEHETVWGNELDKRDYNASIPAMPDIYDKSDIVLNYNKSSLKGNDINLTFNEEIKNNCDVSVQKSYSVAYKNNNFGNLTNTYSYNSLGVKYEKKELNYSNKEKTNYTDTKTIVSTTNLNNNVSYIPSYYSLGYTIDFDQKDIDIIKKITDTYETDNDTLLGFISLDQDPNFSSHEITTKENSASYLMLFNRTEKGVNYSINDNLSTTGEISSTIGFNKKIEPGFVFCGDLRLAAEQSLNYKKELNKTKLEGNISTGVLTDMSIKTGVLKPGVGIGIKANYGISADSKLNDNLMVGMSHSGYVVSTPVSTDTGLNTSVGFKYRKDNDLAFIGNVFVAKENQKLSIGLFNEQTENNVGLGVSLGAKYKRNEFNISYSAKKDKLNPTKNINYIGVGANIKL